MGVKKSTVCTSASSGESQIHSRVVGGVKAYQHIRVELFGQPGEHRVQNPWTQLGRSTRRLDHRGQPYAFVHSGFDYMPRRRIPKWLPQSKWKEYAERKTQDCRC